MPGRKNFPSEETSEADAGWESQDDPDNFDIETDLDE
jgi:hypothetical protein